MEKDSLENVGVVAENNRLKQRIVIYEEELKKADSFMEEINLTGLNSKAKKIVKKYFKERNAYI